MKKQPSIVSPKEFLQHIFCLGLTPFDINSFQYCDNVLEQEFRIAGSSSNTVLSSIRIQELEYL